MTQSATSNPHHKWICIILPTIPPSLTQNIINSSLPTNHPLPLHQLMCSVQPHLPCQGWPISMEPLTHRLEPNLSSRHPSQQTKLGTQGRLKFSRGSNLLMPKLAIWAVSPKQRSSLADLSLPYWDNTSTSKSSNLDCLSLGRINSSLRSSLTQREAMTLLGWPSPISNDRSHTSRNHLYLLLRK